MAVGPPPFDTAEQGPQPPTPQIGINLGSTNSYLSVLETNNPTPKLVKKFHSGVALTPYNATDPDTIFKLQRFLAKIKKTAESHLSGTPFAGVIYTFPSRVTCPQLQATVETGVKVGLHPVGLQEGNFLCAFTAAVAAYGLTNKAGLYAVVDLGGNTLDMALFQVSYYLDNGCFRRKFNLKAPTKLDRSLGGKDFDKALMEHFLGQLNTKNEEGVGSIGVNLSKLCEIAEEAKVKLSSSLEVEINLSPSIITTDDDEPSVKKDVMTTTLTRSKFESLVGDVIEEIKHHCETCLSAAGITGKDVNEVILVGGMARVPIVRKVITELFGKSPRRGVNAEDAVALGAAIAVREGCLGIHSSCVEVLPHNIMNPQQQQWRTRVE